MSFELKTDVDEDCVICCEPLNHDLNFYPCSCGFQVCSMCWHRIRNDEDNKCPNCREPYSDEPFKFSPLTPEQDRKLKELRAREANQVKSQVIQPKPKPPQLTITSDLSRERLSQVRVMQKNLVFVVGLSTKIAEESILRRQEYFGKFGKILKVAVNQSTSYAGTQGPSASAYVTYSSTDSALKCILEVNGSYQDGRTLKATLGTTKYCSRFLNGQVCKLTDCMYLHEVAEDEASFTKEDMSKQKHSEYEKSLMDSFLRRQKERQERERNELKLRQQQKAQQEADARKRAEMLRLQNKRQAEKAKAESLAKKAALEKSAPTPQPPQATIAQTKEPEAVPSVPPPKNKKERAKARRAEKNESKKKAEAESKKQAAKYADPEEEKEEEVRDAWDSSDEELEKAPSTASSSAVSKTPSRQATPAPPTSKTTPSPVTPTPVTPQPPTPTAPSTPQTEKKTKKETKKAKKEEKKKKSEKVKVKKETPPPQKVEEPEVNESRDETNSPPMTQEEAMEELIKMQKEEKEKRELERRNRKETPQEELFTRASLVPTPSPPIVKNEDDIFILNPNRHNHHHSEKIVDRKPSFESTSSSKSPFDPFAKSPTPPPLPPVQTQQSNNSRLLFTNGTQPQMNGLDEKSITPNHSRPQSTASGASSHHSATKEQFIPGLNPTLPGLSLFNPSSTQTSSSQPSLLPQLETASKPLTPPGMVSASSQPQPPPPGLASSTNTTTNTHHDLFSTQRPLGGVHPSPSDSSKRPVKTFDPFDFGSLKQPQLNRPKPQPQRQNSSDPFAPFAKLDSFPRGPERGFPFEISKKSQKLKFSNQ